jgi:RNA polymerase sigma-70 factor (ECF subfamily)
MLADDVRLDIVARTKLNGRTEVGTYFTNYTRRSDWRFAPGFVDGRPAALVYDPGAPSAGPSYFVLLGWSGDYVLTIRDFRHARYAIEGAEVTTP